MTSARKIASDAYVIAAVNQIGQVMDSAQAQQGLTAINDVLGQWSLMPLTIPATAREVFPLTGGRGGPSDPYTIGPGGDFDTLRPTSITNVGLLVTSVVQPFEISRSKYTDDAYASIVQKELTSNYFTGLYYNETFAGGLGTIQLWPVPADASTSLVLYRSVQLREFATLDTAYDFPPGALPALKWEVAKWIAGIVGVPWSDLNEKICDKALSVYQRANSVMTDLGLDAALTAQGGVYNILSDNSSGFQGR